MTPQPDGARIDGRAAAAPVLLVEDTLSLQMIYRAMLASAGHEVMVAGSAAEALAAFQEAEPQIVLLDLLLPDRDGLDVMRDMLSLRPEAQVIVITANGSINRAVEAMRAGAHEFLVKPFDEQRLLDAVRNAATPRGGGQKGQAAAGLGTTQSLIGTSDAMARLHARIRAAARSMATVFITGECGAGKDLCALAVHEQSPRAAGAFVALNCGAIAQDLLDSEVFGHVKGAFPGALSDKPGAVSSADSGTLFLDEVCEMPPTLQTKFLRFLQTSAVQPLGASRSRKVNVRIVCASSRDPLDAVRRGEFREDLYYRLYVVPIQVPPLRDRGDDAIEIAEAALDRFAAEEGRRFDGLTPEVRAFLRQHPWPGNVRQLLNVIRNIAVLHEGGEVTVDMLPADLVRQTGPADGAAPVVPLRTGPAEPDLDPLIGRSLAEIERMVIEATIARHGGSVPKAARVLDLSPSTIYRKMEGWMRG